MNEQNIDAALADMQKRFKTVLLRLPILCGNEALNFVLDNFRRQGFLGHSFQPWPKRKNPTKWGQAPPRNGRALLVDTGKYRRSWRVVRVGPDYAVIGSDDPKARVHNEGLKIGQIQSVKAFTRRTGVQVKAHKRRINQNIPMRKVAGESPYLNTRLKRIIILELTKALK